MSHRAIERLYVLNASLLLTHEIDAAYWREWELLQLPGGLQLFLLANLGLVALVLFGLRALTLGRRSGLWFSLLLAGAGIIANGVHGFFLAGGHPEFRLPVSLALLWASLVVSLAQGAGTLGLLRASRG